MASHPIVLAGQYGSPYTLKMRGVLRYRRIPFRWMLRESKWDDLPDPPVPIIPVIAYPNDDGDGYRELTVDSSPQIMRLEREFDGRSIVPSDPALAVIDALIEDVADEWLTKAMYHYRWSYPADIDKAGKLLPISRDLQLDSDRSRQMYDAITQRQIGRRALVGSTEWNTPIIENSYRRILEALQAQFSTRDFLLGDRPGRGDFGLYGQLTQLVRWDPTPTAIAVEIAPKVVNWVERMDDLSWLDVADDGWASLDSLDPATKDLLAEAGRTYAPFMIANAEALQSGADEVTCVIDGQAYRQGPFRYQGKCLVWLRETYAALAERDRARVDAVLTGTGCEPLFA
ncbi:glutathione S-transferase C-terminal domain-containing protein [Ilumatobacter sp.]|uniref:glutathione S-transferase C-terminal domain-containing protein n=1 Tax=Ilumatobacter sp. TaxID=1967498 RepID=UPI003AF6941A